MQQLSQALDDQNEKPRRRRLWRWGLAVVALLVFLPVCAWIFRADIAVFAVKKYCNSKDLSCEFAVDRLGLSRVSLTDVRVREGALSLASAGRVDVDIKWPTAFSPQVEALNISALRLRLNATGEGPVLGALHRFQNGSDAPQGQDGAFEITAEDAALVIDTPAGEISGDADIRYIDAQTFDIAFAAAPTSLDGPQGRLDLKAAEAKAEASGGEMSADLTLDVSALASDTVEIDALRVNAALSSADTGVRFTADGEASMFRGFGASIAEGRFSSQAQARPFDIAAPSLDTLVAQLTQLEIAFSSDAGAAAGAAWTQARGGAQLTPSRPGRVVEGRADAAFQGLTLRGGGAENAVYAGVVRLDVAEGTEPRLAAAAIDGVLDLNAARLPSEWIEAIANASPKSIPSPLRGHADALADAVAQAAQDFELSAPLELGYAVAGGRSSVAGVLRQPASFKSASGLTISGRAVSDAAPIAKWQPGERGAVASSWEISGGGAPTAQIDIADLVWTQRGATLVGGAVKIEPWRVGRASLALDADAINFAPDPDRYGVLGTTDAELRFSGPAYGATYRGVRLGAPLTFTVYEFGWNLDLEGDALAVAFDRLDGPAFTLDDFASRYTPDGPLMTRGEAGMSGAGAFAPTEFVLTTAGRVFDARAGRTELSWTTRDGVAGRFDLAPSELVWRRESGPAPIAIDDLSGRFVAKDAWELAGAASGIAVRVDDFEYVDGAADFSLGRPGETLVGALSDVRTDIRDVRDAARFAPLSLAGDAELTGRDVDFTAAVSASATGLSLIAGEGRHSLETGAGRLALSPTPLIFRRRGVQPADILPALRGVAANVEGRLDMSGAIAWTRDDVSSSGLAVFTDLDFVTAGAGVFEGVNARIELDDVLKLQSPPGQLATITRLNPGLPIENGALRFQLLGGGDVALEEAVWPFTGGELAVLPTVWSLSAEQNQVTAEARRLDLTEIIDQFNVPDAVAVGRVSGQFPMVFDVGGVRVDNAELIAEADGGVLRYTGDIGAAAGEADSNVQLFFDTIKNFQYQVLKIGLDGDLAGEMTLSLALEGHNPDVLDGFPFNLNVGVTADLVSLLNSGSRAQAYIDAVVDAVSEGREPPAD